MSRNIPLFLLLVVGLGGLSSLPAAPSPSWFTQEGYDLAEPHSLAFYSGREYKNFTCAPVKCTAGELDK